MNIIIMLCIIKIEHKYTKITTFSMLSFASTNSAKYQEFYQDRADVVRD